MVKILDAIKQINKVEVKMILLKPDLNFNFFFYLVKGLCETVDLFIYILNLRYCRVPGCGVSSKTRRHGADKTRS